MGFISLEKYQDRIDDLLIQRKTIDVFHVFKKMKIGKEIYDLKKDLDDVYLNSVEFNSLVETYHDLLNKIYDADNSSLGKSDFRKLVCYLDFLENK